LFIFLLIRISIGLSVFGFISNEYKPIAIQSRSSIHNIWSAIQWGITKVIFDYSILPNKNSFKNLNFCLNLKQRIFDSFRDKNIFDEKKRKIFVKNDFFSDEKKEFFLSFLKLFKKSFIFDLLTCGHLLKPFTTVK
jgi:hypothetical protein